MAVFLDPLTCEYAVPHSTLPLPPNYHHLPQALRVFPDSSCHRWRITISFANNFRSDILRTDMLCGSRVHQNLITLWKSAMSVTYAAAGSTVFSMLYIPQKINPTYRRIMNSLLPRVRIISARVLLVPTITVLLEFAWSVNQIFIPLGNCDLLSILFVTDIVSVQMTSQGLHFQTRGGEAQYCPSQ